ncbi:hypothetical protein Pint_18030 [Pistacia integerrima]|uniref:Uncharacterized protein n=1 Tax=Pistacia integerrima TaxID=434235 RepID=A0ACC0YTW5_9ROSI|nr:hypothetical protein Pint_18030 [Pistacia integerrima]
MLSSKGTITESSILITTSSAETIANNDHLLTELLVCLLIKSLIKFMSVAKHWPSLISNPNFSLRLNPVPKPIIVLFTSCRNTPGYHLINLGSSPPSLFKFLSIGNYPLVTIIKQSCNGLLLGRCLLVTDKSSCQFSGYYVYNPTTQQYTRIPGLVVDGSRLPSLSF